MKKRLILNDFSANKLVTISICIFMTISAMMFGLTILLFGNLSGSIDRLMKEARTPDFLQMHTGEIDPEIIASFADQQSTVESMQICRFLNLQNSQISISGQSLINNMQDNGLSCQSQSFDFLIDSENRIIEAKPGEVYIPVCYKGEYGVRIGDVMRIGSYKLKVAGFLRDSQMNSMMASSKRFLVNQEDYDNVSPFGSEEYLIEFKLFKGSDINAFATAYGDADLPDNGPTITYPLIKMMNALSDGMMILIIFLVSLVVLFISVLCIRYLILTRLEKDKYEIGMLKAIGISKKDIRGLYFSKYLLLSVIGCFTGVLLAMLSARPLGIQMHELYGDPENTDMIYALMVLGAVTAAGIILLSVSRILGSLEKKTAVDVLYGRGTLGKSKNLFLPIGIITAAAVFMILVPLNMADTIKNPGFASYMGIGDSQIRIDIRQTENIEAVKKAVIEEIEQDERVSDHTLMQTGSFKSVLPDGNTYNLLIENGEHSKFPVQYIEGRYPEKDGEIALSMLNAGEMNVSLGDTILVYRDSGEKNSASVRCSICGIYSDITNGGKTAKACFEDPDEEQKLMWSIIYLSLKDGKSVGEWVSEYQRKYSSADNGIKVTEISGYLEGIYGQTIRNISNASVVSVIISCLTLFTVTLLLIRFVIWKERNDISLKKALGFTSTDVQKDYLKRSVPYILSGILLGLFAGIVPGQSLAGMILGFLGAYGFQFIVNPMKTFVLAPGIIVFAAYLAVFMSLRKVRRIRAFECLGAFSGQ